MCPLLIRLASQFFVELFCYCIILYFLISNYKCNIVHLIIYYIVNIVYSLRVCRDTFLAVRHKNVCGCTCVVPVYNFVLYNNVHCMALYNIRVARDIKILNCIEKCCCV